MVKKYLLGIDIGTYESKGTLINLHGEIIGSHTLAHDLLTPKKGWAEHDANEVWWGDFCSITKSMLSRSNINASEIAAVGCSAIAPDVLPVDEDGDPLRNGILYGIDTRADKEIEEMEKQLGANNVFKKSGSTLSSQSVGPKILWIKKNEPEIYRKTYKFLTATSFIVNRLTNEYVIDHYTAAAGFIPFYNIRDKKWDLESNDFIVTEDQLPKIKWTTEIAGYVSKEAALQTGLQSGTPVITGTADAAAEAISVGVGNPGDTMFMYGSSFFLIGITEKPILDSRLWSAPFLFPDTYCLLGGMSTTGTLTRWFKDNIAKDLIEKEQVDSVNPYTRLINESEKVPPGSEGLITLPYFSGERTPINDPRAKGVYFGLSLIHTRAHLFRSILEGVGHGIKSNLDVLNDLGYEPRSLTAVGGGTKNLLWLQIVSDICFRTQYVPEITIGASYGSAILAGLGTGKISSLEETKEWIHVEKMISPSVENHKKYQVDYQVFLELYESTKSLMHRV